MWKERALAALEGALETHKRGPKFKRPQGVMTKMGLPLLPVVDSPSGTVTIQKLREAVFLAKKSVLGNAPPILFLKTALIERMSTAFPLKCWLRPILASS